MSLESKIDELIAALDRNTAAQGGAQSSDAAPPKKGRAKAPTESAQPAATPAQPATAPAAQPAQSPAAPATPAAGPDPQLLVKATETVIKLANEFSREDAVNILGKQRDGRKGVAKCSQLDPKDWQAVLDEAEEAIAKRQAASANASLV
jgi:hypothetical protein